MKHVQVEILANIHQQETLIALLDDLHASGFEQTDEKLVAYFPAEEFIEAEVIKVLKGYHYETIEVAEQNWNALWESNFQPVIVEDFCAVRAHFHDTVSSVKHEIVITPKMSFGTGHHATTYMMMLQMREIDFGQKVVFDFGTGTGILAILAHKLGAKRISAIDVDDWSIENARENFERNDCSTISVTLSSTLPDEQFDVVLANINRNVILAYMQSLMERVHTNGYVLFSGLLVSDETDIVAAAAEHGLEVVRRLERQGWLSLLTHKA